MSANARSIVLPRLQQLAEMHEAGRRGSRWMLRGFGWFFLISLWLIEYALSHCGRRPP